MSIFRSFVAVAAILLSACQSKSVSAPSRSSSSSSEHESPTCEPPPSGEGRCEQECREDECDYEEAGEEAMIHVIEIDGPDDASNALKEESSPSAPNASSTSNL